VVVAADHVRDAHVDVVDDDAEVVRRRAVGAREHEVVELRVGDLDAALHRVVPRDDAVVRVAKADHRRDARRRRHSLRVLRPPAAVVARLLAARLLRRAQRVELFGGHVVAIREAARDQIVERGAVSVHPLRLEVRTLVVVEAEPGHRVDDRLHCFRGRAFGVGILYAQDERAAMPARERPRKQRGADVAEMQEARRTGREAGTDVRHQESEVRSQGSDVSA
jgi:hypothetical protein